LNLLFQTKKNALEGKTVVRLEGVHFFLQKSFPSFMKIIFTQSSFLCLPGAEIVDFWGETIEFLGKKNQKD